MPSTPSGLVIAVIGVLLPLFGTTLLIVLLLERLILSRHAPTRKFLGLAVMRA